MLETDSLEDKLREGICCNLGWLQEDLFDPHNELLLGLTNKEFNGYGIRANELFFAHSMYMVSTLKDNNLKRGFV